MPPPHDDALTPRQAAPRLARLSRPRSLRLPMRDGTLIAVDVHLPARSPAPTILRQTRYLRSLSTRLPGLGAAFDLYARTRRAFVAAGYAWVDVDVRGTGASTGSWPCPWSPGEVGDGAEVVDWVVAQPWSNGRAGALGISYDGTAADMLATTRHPAVRAVAPSFASYDVFGDVAFPGGIQLAWFTRSWSEYNGALDRDAFPEAMSLVLYLLARAGVASPLPRGLERVLAPLAKKDRTTWDARVVPLLRALVRGVRATDDDADRTLLRAAAAEHVGNVDLHAAALGVVTRDQTGLSTVLPDATLDTFSPHAYRAELRASGAAVHSLSGWGDGAYPRSAARRFAEVPTPGSRLTLGPWVHSGKLRLVPFGLAEPAAFDFDADLLSFFDANLAEPRQKENAEPVRYYTMVEGRWKTATRWPPPEVREETLFLAASRALRAEPPRESDASDVHHETGESGTGERSRWRSLISLVPGDYPDRRARDESLLVWETPPLERDLEVTGAPVVSLRVSWDGADDGHVFAYLEDVAPDGRVAYVTEGQLRALFRRAPIAERRFVRAEAAPLAPGEVAELAFDLLPISWLFERGHRVRLAVAGADRDHFAVLAPRTFRVHRSAAHASRLVLPVARP